MEQGNGTSAGGSGADGVNAPDEESEVTSSLSPHLQGIMIESVHGTWVGPARRNPLQRRVWGTSESPARRAAVDLSATLMRTSNEQRCKHNRCDLHYALACRLRL